MKMVRSRDGGVGQVELRMRFGQEVLGVLEALRERGYLHSTSDTYPGYGHGPVQVVVWKWGRKPGLVVVYKRKENPYRRKQKQPKAPPVKPKRATPTPSPTVATEPQEAAGGQAARQRKNPGYAHRRKPGDMIPPWERE
jgi:hypothetical protein